MTRLFVRIMLTLPVAAGLIMAPAAPAASSAVPAKLILTPYVTPQ